MPKNRVDLKHIDCTDNTHYVIFLSSFCSVLDPDPQPNSDPYVRFRASWIRTLIRNLFVRIRILPSTSKKMKKTLNSTVLFCEFFYDFLSLKIDVDVLYL
jgi:hypothetical protein